MLTCLCIHMSLHTRAVKSPITLVFSVNLCSIAGSGAQYIPDITQAVLMTMQNTQPQHTKFSFSTKDIGAQHISDTMQAAAWHKYVHIQETRHLHLLGLHDSPLCRKCGVREETSAHILCECEALASLRRVSGLLSLGAGGY